MGAALKLFEASDSLIDGGVRLGDYLDFELKTKKNKRTLLSRRLIRICSEKKPKKLGEQQISIFSTNDKKIDIMIELVDLIRKNNVKSRYKITSQNGMLFKLNGNYTLSAFIERGDLLEIYERKLNFSSKESNSIVKTNLYDHILMRHKLISSELPILIEGQTGTGKTTLAKSIHEKSRRIGEFVHINLSAFSPQLIESELFGHVRGAFTGADSEKLGAFRIANGGTLFLDEIDSLPLEIQTKLLLFLDNQTVRPVGGEKLHQVSCRLIFSSGKNLNTLVGCKLMREDFFFRLNTGFSFQLSALRNDTNSIKHICRNFSLDNNVTIDSKLIDFYMTLPWPGNIRQLISVLNRKKVITSGRKLTFDEYDNQLISQSSDLSKLETGPNKSMQEVKKEYALKVFSENQSNYTIAAKKLDISRKTLKRLLS